MTTQQGIFWVLVITNFNITIGFLVLAFNLDRILEELRKVKK